MRSVRAPKDKAITKALTETTDKIGLIKLSEHNRLYGDEREPGGKSRAWSLKSGINYSWNILQNI